MDDITLTPQELEDLKDEIKFKTTVLLELKISKKERSDLKKAFDDHAEASELFRDKVKSHGIQLGFQWLIVSTIFIGLLGLAYKIIFKAV